MPWFGPGLGWGRGWRWRRCWFLGIPGRGWRWRYWWRWVYVPEDYTEVEKILLKNEAEILRRQLQLIEKRLTELEQKNKEEV